MFLGNWQTENGIQGARGVFALRSCTQLIQAGLDS